MEIRPTPAANLGFTDPGQVVPPPEASPPARQLAQGKRCAGSDTSTSPSVVRFVREGMKTAFGHSKTPCRYQWLWSFLKIQNRLPLSVSMQ